MRNAIAVVHLIPPFKVRSYFPIFHIREKMMSTQLMILMMLSKMKAQPRETFANILSATAELQKIPSECCCSGYKKVYAVQSSHYKKANGETGDTEIMEYFNSAFEYAKYGN